jgi:hypothetical protein
VKSNDEIFREACYALVLDGSNVNVDLAVDSTPFSAIPIVGTWRAWVLEALIRLGCERREEFRQACRRAIQAQVTYTLLQRILNEVLDAIIYAVCQGELLPLV